MMSRFPARAVLAAVCLAMAAYAHGQAGDSANAPAASVALSPSPAEPDLTADLFYRLLLGDVALQRGDLKVSARAFLEAARSTNDPRLANRATEIAIASRDRPLVRDAAELWSRLDPHAERPKRVLAALEADKGGGGIPSGVASEELRSRIERVLSEAALSGPGVGDVFMQLNRLFSQQSDKRAVLSLVRDVAKPYPKTPEAHYAIALAAFGVGPDDAPSTREAREEIDQALALRPDWERAAVLKSEIVERESPAEATKWLESFVGAHPEAKSAAGALAQQYVEQRRFADARALMQRLWDREPGSRDLQFAVASIALQMKDYPEAERLLLELKTAGYGEPGVIDLYLAQVAEETKQYEKAIERYRLVTDGDRGWLAKLRVGAMYGKLGRLDEARRWLAGLDAVTREQKIQVKQAEAQVLRDAGDDAGAYRVLAQGLSDHPDTPDLIYDLAMVAEKLDKIDEAETRLKRLVELKPDDAQALNALGYTLVDRTPRTDEGLAFIERAHKLAPRDPFILDSLGWALYRKGRLDDAERYLQQALDGRPDAEIAAHLGEVLWRKGERDKARALWKAQLDSNPDNAVLKETVKRLTP
ncbi:MAG TPA: tetratricopeptide repeat protein [Casimicrobiaceae bacterium]